jgi:hypothetical protein
VHLVDVPEQVLQTMLQDLHSLSIESPYWPAGHVVTQDVKLRK